MGKWWVAGLLLCAATLTGFLAGTAGTINQQWAQSAFANGKGRVVAAGYTGRLLAVLQEHRSLLYHLNTLPSPELINRLGALERSISQGATWLDQIGEGATAGALRTYVEGASVARTEAGRPTGATALAGPAHLGAESALRALRQTGERLEGEVAVSVDLSAGGTESGDLFYLLAGLMALLALLAALSEESVSHTVAVVEARKLPLGLLAVATAIHNGSSGLSAGSRETARTVEELRSGLREIAMVESSHLRRLEEVVLATKMAQGAMHRVATAEGYRIDSSNTTDREVRQVAVLAAGLVQRVEMVTKPLQGARAACIAAKELTESAAATASALSGSVQQSQRSIEGLKERASEVERLVTAVNAIAVQTNILALNAAIEAARAGESGRGFAVVADSVRKLAGQAQQHAREIEKRVVGIGQAAFDAAAEVEEHGRLAQIAAAVLDEAVAQTRTTSELLRGPSAGVAGLLSETSQLMVATEGLIRATELPAAQAMDLKPIERTLELVGTELHHLQTSKAELHLALTESERLASTATELTGATVRGGVSVELVARRLLAAIHATEGPHNGSASAKALQEIK